MSDQPLVQLFWLFVLAIPVACAAWTVTHEEVFREPREYCVHRSQAGQKVWERKFFYLFTCEYCFSHYVTLFFILLTGYRLLLDDWRGYLLSFFAVVWVANIYMSLFSRLRVDITSERVEVKHKEKVMEKLQGEIEEKSEAATKRPSD
ncbi:MAG: hypothetical protein ACM359_01950 [Bacillota bacterium]